MKLSAILLLVLIGIIVWSTMRMNRRRDDARRGRDRDGGPGNGSTPAAGSGGRDQRSDPDRRGDAHDGGGNGGGD
jgi:hypothetical protein